MARFRGATASSFICKMAAWTRTEGGKREEVVHRSGDVVWRPKSNHLIENAGASAHEVLIVELK